MNPLDGSTIGLRVPNWESALNLLQQTGPLATTSVNYSGQPPLLQLHEIHQAFPQVLTPPKEYWQLPTPPEGKNLPSTVVKWVNAGWQILRQGSVTFTE
jgi:L-threonylcarbamoyladenylate synthase